MKKILNKRLNWDKYTWEDFEDICFEYVSERYNSDAYIVQITQRKKDGGRDIIISDIENNTTTWGECKHHKSSIGLSHIGKNVVLAITNQINKIIFFSVSHITPNTKHEILCAARIHNFEVCFLDGVDLDYEIAGNRKILSKYFSESFSLYHPNKHAMLVEYCVDEFPNAYNDTFYNDNKYCSLEKGLDFYIHIFLKNCYDDDISDIHIAINDSICCHFYNTNIVIERIKPICDTVVTIHGILLNTQRRVNIPPIIISYIWNEKKFNIHVLPGELDGTNIWRVPFCGDENIKFISNFTKISQQVMEGYVKVIYLKGASGSGKTRMLEEISTVMEEKGFVTVYIDSMIYRKHNFYKEFIRQLLCLPEINYKDLFTENDFKNLLIKYHIYFPDIPLLYKYLWSNRRISVALLGELVFQCIINSPIKSKIVLQIDNIQYLNEEIQQSIVYLCSLLLKDRHYICIVLSLNTSLSKISLHTPLLQYLDNQVLHPESSSFIQHPMGELDEKSRAYIVKTCLKLDYTYNKEVQEISERAGALPLDILLFCKVLYNSECFSWINNSCEITNPEIFSRQLNIISNVSSSVIDIRLNSLYGMYSSKKNLLKLFELIIFFNNRLPIELVEHFNIKKDYVTNLKRDLVIIERSDGHICFFHDNYYRYFLQKDTLYSFDYSELNKLYQFSKLYEESSDGLIKIGQAKCLFYMKKYVEFCAFSEELLDDFCSKGYYNDIITLTDFYLERIHAYEYKNQRLHFALENALAQIEIISFSQGVSFLDKIKSELEQNILEYNIEMVCRFYHQYCNAYTHAGKYTSAIAILNDYNKIENIPTKYKFIIEDRYCLCYLSIGNFAKADVHIKTALEIAKQEKNDFWISTAYSDYAFNYLTNIYDKKRTSYYFKKAVDYYSPSSDNSIYRKIEIKIQTALAFLLDDQCEVALKHIDEALKYAKEKSYTYLLIPAQNVKSFILLLLNRISESILLLNEARFNCEIFGSTKQMITICNTLGITYSLANDSQRAYQCFEKAEKMLRQFNEPGDSSNRYLPLIVNLIYSSLCSTNLNYKLNAKDYYNNYYSLRLAKIFSEYMDEVTCNYISINLADHFPLSVGGYVFMY